MDHHFQCEESKHLSLVNSTDRCGKNKNVSTTSEDTYVSPLIDFRLQFMRNEELRMRQFFLIPQTKRKNKKQFSFVH